jgi:hypothetical protein
MKDIVQSLPAERHAEQEFANRKLIRPSLSHSNHSGPNQRGKFLLPKADAVEDTHGDCVG